MKATIRALVRNWAGAHTTKHFTSEETMRDWCGANEYDILRYRELEDGEWKGEPEA